MAAFGANPGERPKIAVAKSDAKSGSVLAADKSNLPTTATPAQEKAKTESPAATDGDKVVQQLSALNAKMRLFKKASANVYLSRGSVVDLQA